MLQIKIMSCRSKLMSVLFKQNTIALPFKDPLQRVQSNVIFYNSFHSGRKTGQSPVNKVWRRFRRNSAFGKDKFIARLNMRTNFSNQTDLLNTFRVGLNRVRFGIKLCCLRQKNLNLTQLCQKEIILALKLKKLKQEVTFLTQDVTIHKPSQRACNQDVTTLKQGVTIVPQDVTTLEQEVTKNIQYMIIHRRIPTIFKKDNTNQNAGLEKRRPNQGIGANIRRLLTMYLRVLYL